MNANLSNTQIIDIFINKFSYYLKPNLLHIIFISGMFFIVGNLKGYKAVETRELKTLEFSIDDAFVVEGQEIEMTIHAGEDMNLNGYQFSMELDGLAFKSIAEKSIPVGEENIGLINEDLITMSYHESKPVSIDDGNELFSMVLKVQKTGKLSDMIYLSSKLTQNEAYITNGVQTSHSNDLELKEVALRFDNQEDIVMENLLYQNEPNPFHKVTSIGFDLAVPTDVTLTIMTASGSVVTSFDIEGKKGHNIFELNANLIGLSGLYYYKLECEGFSDTKKMILMR